MRFFARGDREKRPGDESVKEKWQIVQGERAGRPLIARFNAGAQHLAGSPRYGIQIGVAIPLRLPDSRGLPQGKEFDEINSIEETLLAKVAGRALLVGVITTGGMREFVLYTGSGEWIRSFHEEMRAAITTHEVQVMAQADPDWSVFRQFIPT